MGGTFPLNFNTSQPQAFLSLFNPSLPCCRHENVATSMPNFYDLWEKLSTTAGLTVGDLQGENH
jgi:hypothetical protein